MGAWKFENRRLLFCSCNHEELGAPVWGGSFKVIVSKMWRKLLFCLQGTTAETQHPELVVVHAIQNEQHCNPQKLDVEQLSSFRKRHVGAVFIHKVMNQARY